MKNTTDYVIKVITNSNSDYLYPGIALGTSIFKDIDSVLDKFNELKNRTGCVVYSKDVIFEIKPINEVKKLVIPIKSVVNI